MFVAGELGSTLVSSAAVVVVVCFVMVVNFDLALTTALEGVKHDSHSMPPLTEIPDVNLTGISEHMINVGDLNIYYLEVDPVTVGVKRQKQDVLLLHGDRFSSETWLDLGTLTLLGKKGYHTIAVDLPGNGRSLSAAEPQSEGARVKFLKELMSDLRLKDPVIVSPCLSGIYTIPYIQSDWKDLAGFVPIAPSGTEALIDVNFKPILVPTVVVCGGYDYGIGERSINRLRFIKGSQVEIIKNTGHACYVENPTRFHDILTKFLTGLH